MVDELEKCQQAFRNIDGIHEGFLSPYSEEQFNLLEEYTPYPKIWAPYYTLHKIIVGLLGCATYINKKFLYCRTDGRVDMAQIITAPGSAA